MKTPKTSAMVKQIATAFSLVLSLGFALPALAQKKGRHARVEKTQTAPVFLEAIEVGPATNITPIAVSSVGFTTTVPKENAEAADKEASVESASDLQLKYAVLLDTEVESLQDTDLLAAIDDWYGTRYELGGSSKDGVDCSALVQALYSKLFQIAMPRTAKEQYKAVHAVSRTSLQTGDLVFFNTRGSGVSHVGIYLQHNKFVHAATSGGVMISDLFEEYWVKHWVAAGRFPETASVPSTVKP